jgi:hypothetical protein
VIQVQVKEALPADATAAAATEPEVVGKKPAAEPAADEKEAPKKK